MGLQRTCKAQGELYMGQGRCEDLADNAVVDAIKLILLNCSNFNITKIVVKKIERVK